MLIRARQQRIQLLRIKNERTSFALKLAQDRIKSFLDNIHKQQTLIEHIEAIPAKTGEIMNANQMAVLEELRKAVILTKENWIEFQEMFETVHPGYIDHMETTCPNCTPSEYRLMVLDKLDLTNKEMASMLGVSQETIRSTRSRMKKKLGSAGESDNVVG